MIHLRQPVARSSARSEGGGSGGQAHQPAREPMPERDFAALPRLVTLWEITQLVCEAYGVRRTELMSIRRQKWLVDPRHVAMWLAHRYTSCSLPQIGHHMRRDHTTVMHGCRRVEKQLATDPNLAHMVEGLCRAIESRPDGPAITARPPPSHLQFRLARALDIVADGLARAQEAVQDLAAAPPDDNDQPESTDAPPALAEPPAEPGPEAETCPAANEIPAATEPLAPRSGTPALFHRMVLELQRDGDVVLSLGRGEFAVNGHSIGAADLVERANRMRRRQNLPAFLVGADMLRRCLAAPRHPIAAEIARERRASGDAA